MKSCCLQACCGLFVALCCFAPPGPTQLYSADSPVTPLPGHSYHGAAFDEGPRQQAYLMGGTGRVQFPVTTQQPEAQAFFLQGLGQLHGFWFWEAERSFRQAARLDPDCAMAYWGMACANLENRPRAQGFIAEAVKRKAHTTSKEQLWIEAAERFYSDSGDEVSRGKRYVEDLEALVRAFPEDLEPKAMLAVQIYRNGEHGIPVSSRQAVESLIQEILRVEPAHPAHHFRIHNWDPGEASVALTSAALCGQSAPKIAHMWHMPGHIYSKLHRYQDAAWQQEASARVDHAQMMRDRLLPDQIHNYVHNNDWLIGNLSHVGRVSEGVLLAKNLIELPQHPRYNKLGSGPAGSSRAGRSKLFEVLVRWEEWETLIALAGTNYLAPTEFPAEQTRRLHALGVAQFRKGDTSAGQATLADLVQLSLALDAGRQTELEQAESRAKAEAKTEDAAKLQAAADQARTELEQQLKERRELLDDALVELRGLASLAAGDFPAARDYFNRLNKLSKSRLAPYYLAAQDFAKAEQLANEGVSEGVNEVQPLAVLVEVFERQGKHEQAQAKFEELRTVAAFAELELPILRRLRTVADRMQLPHDWRKTPPQPGDLGIRPSLESLGPVRWQPSPAPGWSLPDRAGELVSLDQFRGKPVLVIFYLGFGCLHCQEQLKTFSSRLSAFEEQGIQVLAITTEGQESLRQGLANFERDRPFPIRILSDESLATFKAYRAFDDFEGQPLHGTFLIDSAGLVRWQDVSPDPFQEVEFVLGEAKRLLHPTLSTPWVAMLPATAEPSR